MNLGKRAAAEFFGTFWLVFGGCGSAVLAAAFPALGIGFVGVALAFGLTVLTMAYAIGHISGCHLNPAVSLGLVAGKRFPASELLPYWIAQVLGGIAGAGVPLRHRLRQSRLRSLRRFRFQRVRRTFPRRLLHGRLPRRRNCTHLFFPAGDHGRHRQTRSLRFRRHRHRPRAHSDSLDRNSRHQLVRQPGAQHRSRRVRRQLGHPSTLALLARSPRRRSNWRRHLQLALRHSASDARRKSVHSRQSGLNKSKHKKKRPLHAP